MLLVTRALDAKGAVALSVALSACSRPAPDVAGSPPQKEHPIEASSGGDRAAPDASSRPVETPEPAPWPCRVRVRLAHRQKDRPPDLESLRDFSSLFSSFDVVEHGNANGPNEVSFYDAPFAPPNLRDESSPWRALFACCGHVDTCRELNSLFRRNQERDAHGDTIYFVDPDVEETPIQPDALEFPPCADPRVRLTVRRKHEPSDLLSFREFSRVYSDFVLVEDGAAKALHQISLYEAPYPGPLVDGKPNPWRALFARCGDMRTCRKLELLYQKVRLLQDGYWATRSCGPPHPGIEETSIAPEMLAKLPPRLSATAACTRIRSCQEARFRGQLECEYARPAELERCAAEDDCADVLTCAVKLDQTLQPRRPVEPQPRKQPPDVFRVF